MSNVTITITLQEAQLLYRALVELPYKEVGTLPLKLQAQVQAPRVASEPELPMDMPPVRREKKNGVRGEASTAS